MFQAAVKKKKKDKLYREVVAVTGTIKTMATWSNELCLQERNGFGTYCVEYGIVNSVDKFGVNS